MSRLLVAATTLTVVALWSAAPLGGGTTRAWAQDESRRALGELSEMLGLGSIYEFQR